MAFWNRGLRKKVEELEQRLAESDGDIYTGVDPDEFLWRPINYLGYRDLPRITHKRAQDVAFTLWRQNPLGHRITELNRDYIVGDGITWSATNPDVEEVITEFWNDPTGSGESMDLWIPRWGLELGLFGELCLEAFTGDVSGVVQLGYIDPIQIKSVTTVQNNPLVSDIVWISKKGTGQKGQPVKIIRPRAGSQADDSGDATDSSSDDEGPTPEGDTLEGDCFYFAVNKISNATRGWPDLLSVADWLDAYDQTLWNTLERSILARAFIWDVTLQGMDQTGIDTWTRKNSKPPKTGSVRAHNDKVTWKAEAPPLGSYEAAKEAQMILEHIAGGAGFPKFYLSAAEDVNRATAIEMGSPTVKRLQMRQGYFVASIERILHFVLDQAKVAGRISVDTEGLMPAHDDDGTATSERHKPHELVQVHAPEISVKDTEGAGDTLNKVTAALSVMVTEKLISQDVARQVIASVLSQLGVDYDPKEEPEDDPGTPDPQLQKLAAMLTTPPTVRDRLST